MISCVPAHVVLIMSLLGLRCMQIQSDHRTHRDQRKERRDLTWRQRASSHQGLTDDTAIHVLRNMQRLDLDHITISPTFLIPRFLRVSIDLINQDPSRMARMANEWIYATSTGLLIIFFAFISFFPRPVVVRAV